MNEQRVEYVNKKTNEWTLGRYDRVEITWVLSLKVLLLGKFLHKEH